MSLWDGERKPKSFLGPKELNIFNSQRAEQNKATADGNSSFSEFSLYVIRIQGLRGFISTNTYFTPILKVILND